jgi:hypothetical protein
MEIHPLVKFVVKFQMPNGDRAPLLGSLLAETLNTETLNTETLRSEVESLLGIVGDLRLDVARAGPVSVATVGFRLYILSDFPKKSPRLICLLTTWTDCLRIRLAVQSSQLFA